MIAGSKEYNIKLCEVLYRFYEAVEQWDEIIGNSSLSGVGKSEYEQERMRSLFR